MLVRRMVVSLVVVGALAGCGSGEDPAAEPQDTTVTRSQPPTGSPSASPAPSTATPSATPITSTEPPTEAPTWPPYAWSASPVTVERLGPTYREGCPVGPDDLRLLAVSYVDFDGRPSTGELVVAAEVVEDVAAAFGELYEARFPVRTMITIEAYGGDDDASMAADNTSAFNCRAVTGGSGFSQHSFGVAIDINPRENPYVRGDVVLPPDGAGYLDRVDVRPGMIVDGDVVVRAFTSRGFEWGGGWTTLKDYQHVEMPRER